MGGVGRGWLEPVRGKKEKEQQERIPREEGVNLILVRFLQETRSPLEYYLIQFPDLDQTVYKAPYGSKIL